MSADLTDPDLYASGDPHATFAELRRSPGLRWHPEAAGPGFWSVTRYRDCLAAYRDASFTTTRGTLLAPDRGRSDPAWGKMLVMTDPPRHTKLRAVLNRGFTPAVVARLRERLATEIAALLDRALEARDVDFVTDVAARIPVVMICDMMGVPQADWDRMHGLTRVAFGSADPDYQLSPSERLSKGAAHTQILGYYARLLAERRRAPREDIVSTLATAEVDGRRLSDEEVLLDCDNLMVGGNETTRHAAAGGLLALIQHPDQLSMLRAEPGRLDAAVEEILRWTTPAIHIMRTARRETEVGGQAVRPGQQVVIWNLSANRDEAEFHVPGQFDVTRSENRHLSLGFGEHFCIGAALARMELRLLFEQLLARVRSVELGGPPERLRSNVIWGYKRLPVSIT
jgi:cytochrome P450